MTLDGHWNDTPGAPRDAAGADPDGHGLVTMLPPPDRRRHARVTITFERPLHEAEAAAEAVYQ